MIESLKTSNKTIPFSLVKIRSRPISPMAMIVSRSFRHSNMTHSPLNSLQYKFKSNLNNIMNKTIKNTVPTVDVVLFVIEALKWDIRDLKELERVKKSISDLEKDLKGD